MVLKQHVLELLSKRKLIFNKLDTNVSKIYISSYDKYFAKIAAEFCRDALKNMGCSVSIEKKPTQLQRWTVLSSPFAHKTARTQFEKRTIKYSVKFNGLNTEGFALAKWYFSTIAPPTVQIS